MNASSAAVGASPNALKLARQCPIAEVTVWLVPEEVMLDFLAFSPNVQCNELGR